MPTSNPGVLVGSIFFYKLDPVECYRAILPKQFSLGSYHLSLAFTHLTHCLYLCQFIHRQARRINMDSVESVDPKSFQTAKLFLSSLCQAESPYVCPSITLSILGSYSITKLYVNQSKAKCCKIFAISLVLHSTLFPFKGRLFILHFCYIQASV